MLFRFQSKATIPLEVAIDDALRMADGDIEINYRDVEDYILENGEMWRYYDDNEHGIFIINNIAYDLCL